MFPDGLYTAARKTHVVSMIYGSYPAASVRGSKTAGPRQRDACIDLSKQRALFPDGLQDIRVHRRPKIAFCRRRQTGDRPGPATTIAPAPRRTAWPPPPTMMYETRQHAQTDTTQGFP